MNPDALALAGQIAHDDQRHAGVIAAAQRVGGYFLALPAAIPEDMRAILTRDWAQVEAQLYVYAVQHAGDV